MARGLSRRVDVSGPGIANSVKNQLLGNRRLQPLESVTYGPKAIAAEKKRASEALARLTSGEFNCMPSARHIMML